MACILATIGCWREVEAAALLTSLFSFNQTNGAVPEATLVQGIDGYLYGTTIDGGTNGTADGSDGTIFRISTNGTFTNLISLTRDTGSNPQSGLLAAADGSFYGVTDYGGQFGCGAAYKLTRDGSFVPLCSLAASNGVYPHGLTWGNDGNLYGTACWGGTAPQQLGTVFKLTPEGKLSTLVSFDGDNGANPRRPYC